MSRLQKFSWILAFGFLVFLPLQVKSDEAEPDFECRFSVDTTATPTVAPSTGVAKGVAIYATWDSTTHPKRDTLPFWWKNIWDSTQQLSVPKYFKDNSQGNYRMQITPFGRDGDTLFCYKTAIFPDTEFDPVFFEEFIDSILTQADEDINFANYDADSDNVVDAVFLIVTNMNVSARGTTLIKASFETKDSSGGLPMLIVGGEGHIGGNGLNIFANSDQLALAISAHEWGHCLGLDDLYGGLGNVWWGLGSFSIMGAGWPNNRAVPIDPYHRIKLGWATATEVTAPRYVETIPDYLTTGTIYKVSKSSGEYFLVTNHRGVNPFSDQRGKWEEFFKGYGLLIWHIDTTGNTRVRSNKLIDVELAHGLWNLDTLCRRVGADTLPNPVYGRDSLDCAKIINKFYYGYQPNEVQSGTCFWNGSPKATFDGLSNPSSDGYRDSIVNSMRVQNIPSHLANRNISDTLYHSATADLLVNNWYGHVSANTTWGPGVYAITGDITVDSGVTLTIEPGTTIIFQKNEDNQSSGGYSTKSELIVKRNPDLPRNGG
ncbi:MAG TPA: hypothetical protein VNL73_10465 [Verrucomicrobiae bacterium]|nr:hypothetical protein [Verrucomicrobiae bacterium]